LQRAANEHRATAAAALFRLTGEAQYGEVFERAMAAKIELYQHTADGAWEYYRADPPAANRELQERIGKAFLAEARRTANAQTQSTYANIKHPFAPIGWGQGLAPDYNQAQMFIRAYQVERDPLLIRTMQDASAHILGANQVGLSFTTGLGLRNIKHPLHEDHRAMGIKAPDGITIYGWAPQSATSHEWIFGPYWSALPEYGERENARHRKVAPNRFAMPFYEYLIEHPLLVMQQEYTVHQSIGTTAAMWLFLHAAGTADADGRNGRTN
jgi:endoglucanase